MEKVLFNIPHVKLVRLDSGRYCLVVEDTLVNDLVEDFLWDDYVYQATTVSVPGKSMPAVYSNYFDDTLPVEALIEMLQQLDPAEVEQAFKIHNG
ncbi:hypothetical protein [Flavihumibacter petaseus]|uniref:Uncharacterized protein n=1 Tax=Flavihumibacter petaseus NBRC 106054 TaxID=1220578 RepID=A0A0E9MZA5_9BACT|nr:hypothetical protein [Flavihumibacter petaseus]GAO42721.1 hypothetical protein FPE01S_01_17380 [Flavihumibacter petaseus NBRC 106054]